MRQILRCVIHLLIFNGLNWLKITPSNFQKISIVNKLSERYIFNVREFSLDDDDAFCAIFISLFWLYLSFFPMTTVIKRMTFNKKFVVKIIYGRSIDATRVTIFTARARQWFKLTSFNNFEISIWELVFNDPVFFMTISFLYA
jgi:hypothetical protein